MKNSEEALTVRREESLKANSRIKLLIFLPLLSVNGGQ
jgi:hypothetical protein